MYKYKDPYQLDFRHVQTYGEVHKIIRAAMDFPDYYGENWDAFWDCLTDMTGRPLHVQIAGLDVLQRKFPEACAQMLEALRDLLQQYGGDISVEILAPET